MQRALFVLWSGRCVAYTPPAASTLAPDESRKLSLSEIHLRHPLEGGSWDDEVAEAAMIHKVVQPGDRVLEIGANVGRSTIVAARTATASGSVVSSEADPSRLRLAQRNAGPELTVAFIPAISAEPLYLPQNGANTRMNGIASRSVSGGAAAPRADGTPALLRVPTLPPSAVQDSGWDVLIVDCEGCFSPLMASLDTTRFLNGTRAIVLENDATDLRAQNDTHAALRAHGFSARACVRHPWKDGSDPLFHGCFWSLLLRDEDGAAVQRRPPPPTVTFERKRSAAGVKEDIHELWARVQAGLDAMPIT